MFKGYGWLTDDHKTWEDYWDAFRRYRQARYITNVSKPAAAIIVTKNASDFGAHSTNAGKDMIRIPAFAFLYLLGHAEKNGYKGIE